MPEKRESELSVLVVDDDVATLAGLKELLRRAGYRVLTANTYEAAKFVLSAGYPDVLVVDIRLGDFNGLQFIATAPTPIPAVVMTGHDDVDLERETRMLGAEFLLKPVSPEILLDAIERQINARRGHPYIGEQ